MHKRSFTRQAVTFVLSGLVGFSVSCGNDPRTPEPGAGSGDPVGAGDPSGSGGGGSGSGAGAGGGASVDGDETKACEQFSIENGRVTPDMLIVLDRSSSMQSQGVDRWNPSVSGIKSITGELDGVIRFGLMAFPGRGDDTTRGGGRSCAPGTLEVPIGLDAAPAIAASLDGLSLIRSTPTAATLGEAHSALAAEATGESSKYVILVTDGAPNCSDGDSGRGSGASGQDPAAVTASVAAIAAMEADGIKTYVVGYDTQSDAALKAALDEMAQAGGTGATAHSPIEDEAGLVKEFRSIIGAARVGCTFSLSTPPSDPDYVLVELDGEKLPLDGDDGFVLNADGTTLTVQGAACTKLQSATDQHVLSVTVKCERQTPLF